MRQCLANFGWLCVPNPAISRAWQSLWLHRGMGLQTGITVTVQGQGCWPLQLSLLQTLVAAVGFRTDPNQRNNSSKVIFSFHLWSSCDSPEAPCSVAPPSRVGY